MTKPTKWERVLSWLRKTRPAKRKKQPRVRKSHGQEPPVLSLEDAFTFKPAPKLAPAMDVVVGYIGKARVPWVRARSLQKRIDRQARWENSRE